LLYTGDNHGKKLEVIVETKKTLAIAITLKEGQANGGIKETPFLNREAGFCC
jgi:hypothetical protein